MFQIYWAPVQNKSRSLILYVIALIENIFLDCCQTTYLGRAIILFILVTNSIEWAISRQYLGNFLLTIWLVERSTIFRDF